jgi:hypothetical protein
LVLSGLGVPDFEKLDAYEGEEYERVRVRLDTPAGLEAWAYLLKAECLDRLSDEVWDLAQFGRERASIDNL